MYSWRSRCYRTLRFLGLHFYIYGSTPEVEMRTFSTPLLWYIVSRRLSWWQMHYTPCSKSIGSSTKGPHFSTRREKSYRFRKSARSTPGPENPEESERGLRMEGFGEDVIIGMDGFAGT